MIKNMVNECLLSEGVFVELDEDHAHVITAKLLLVGILSQHPVQHLFYHLLRTFPLYALLTNQSDEILPIALIPLPNTVTAHQYEVIVFAELHHLDIRVSGNGLSIVG